MESRIPHPRAKVEVRRAFQRMKQKFFDESSDVDHDATTNFVANEHIDHTAVSVSAGTGLSGGGTIAANRTISLSHLGIESLADPDDDRILFWDDSANASEWLTLDASLTITDTTLSVVDGSVDHGGLFGLGDDDHAQYLLTDGTRDITGNLTLNIDSRHMLLGSSAIAGEFGRFALQSLTAGSTMFLDLYTNDGDSTDMVGLAVWAKGAPGQWTNTEILQFYWDPGNAEFTLNAYAGGTGTSRQLNFYTLDNRGQLLLTTDGAVHVGDDLYVNPGGHTFLFRDGMAGASLGRLAIQAQSAGADTFIDIHSHDGDTTDYVGLAIWGEGLPNSFANIELYQSYWDPVNSEYATTVYIAGSGMTRPINFYTFGNRGQLLLQTSGAISMSGTLAVTGNITGPNVSSGADPGHTHTGASLGSIDISADTNLAATAPIILADDTLSLDYEATDFAVVGTSFTIANTGIDHDATTNFVANEHIDHTGVTLTAGLGISGGGDISANRTFALDINELAAAAVAAVDTFPFHDDTAGACRKIAFSDLNSSLVHDSLSGYDSEKHIPVSTSQYQFLQASDGVGTNAWTLTPILGGDFDVAAYRIFTSTANGDMTLEPNGTGAFRLSSTGNARGDYAVDLQTRRVAVTQVASGFGSSLIGCLNSTASNTGSFVCGGSTNAATGQNAFTLGGVGHVNVGNQSGIIGGYYHEITSAGYNSIILGGRYGNLKHRNCMVQGTQGFLSESGRAQREVASLLCQTSAIAQEELFTNGDGGSYVLNLLYGDTWYYTVKILAVKEDSEINSYSEKIEGIITRTAGGTQHVAGPTVVRTFGASLGTILVDDPDHWLRVQVTPNTTDSIFWLAFVDMVCINGYTP